jgi:integrase
MLCYRRPGTFTHVLGTQHGHKARQMPRNARATRLETRTARLKLPVARKPYWAKLGHGFAVGYRRNQTAGSWSVRVADGKGGHWIRAIGTADDFDEADGDVILDFWQAQDRARTIALGARHDHAGKLVTVRGAVDAYRANLEARGADVGNANRILGHLPDTLAGKTVALLAARDFGPWREALAAAGLAPAAFNRVTAMLKAALNLAADQDERIGSRRAWGKGLALLPNATESRNVILPEADIRSIIAAAYNIGPEFGAFIEVLAVTGARPSQAARLEVGDVQADRPDPRLMMPASRKGRGRTRIERRPVPVPASLANRLAALGEGRPRDAVLLLKPDGTPWGAKDHGGPFAVARAAAGLGDEVTAYTIRHSSVTRQLLAGIPIRVVAVNHDTSVTMLEKTYSKFIGDHSDTLTRRALLDTAEPADSNVIPIAASRP